MAFQEITSPPMLDETGQDIVSVLRQIYSKYDVEKSTLREVPFGVGVNDWVASDDVYIATVSSAYVTTTSKEFTTFTATLRSSAKGDISVDKIHGGGGITLTTNVLPTGTINGTLYVIDADDGKVPILIEDTVVPVSNGGTGESTVAGAQNVLGITALSESLADEVSDREAADSELNNNIAKLQDGIAIIVDGDTAALAVPVGGYAYVKNNQHGLAEGMYKNTSSGTFPVSGGKADSTVFTSVPSGAVNDAVSTSRTNYNHVVAYRSGNVVTIRCNSFPANIPAYGTQVIDTIDAQYRPKSDVTIMSTVRNSGDGSFHNLMIVVKTIGEVIAVNYASGDIVTGTQNGFTLTYVV